MIAAGLAAGGQDQGYFVIVLGLIWSVVFGLLLLRMTAGSASFPQVMQYLFDPHQAPEDETGRPDRHHQIGDEAAVEVPAATRPVGPQPGDGVDGRDDREQLGEQGTSAHGAPWP